jgi:uncharacterized protein with PQ loop repeat
MSTESFAIGLLVGAGSVAITSFVVFLFIWLGRIRNRFYQPQQIQLYTTKTPAQVQRAASWAGLGHLGLIILLLAGIWLVIAQQDPLLAWELLYQLLRLLIMLIEGLIVLLRSLQTILVELCS